MRESVCLVRFHTGRTKPNWGGRATSIALAGEIEALPGYRIGSVVEGAVITDGFGDFEALDKLVVRRRAAGSLMRRRPYLHRPWADIDDFVDRFLRRARHPAAVRARAALASSDEVWMNGEGDFVLSDSGTLWRSLILLRAAVAMGKPVRLVNSLLSPRADGSIESAVRDAVGDTLARLDCVAYRDPGSAALHRQLFPDIDARWMPDALFAWVRDDSSAHGAGADGPSRAFGSAAEGLPLALQRGGLGPMATISGTSGRVQSARAARDIGAFVRPLHQSGISVAFAGSDAGDGWLARIASSLGCPWAPAAVPLASAARLLSMTSVLVSGRYHPSILAATRGTPAIVLRSNSHKSQQLEAMLGDGAPAPHRPFFGDDDFDGAALAREAIAEASAGWSRRVQVADRARALADEMAAGFAQLAMGTGPIGAGRRG